MLSDDEAIVLIEQLRTIREEISIVIGMYNKISMYKDNILDAKKNIDIVLYNLTGDKYYTQETA